MGGAIVFSLSVSDMLTGIIVAAGLWGMPILPAALAGVMLIKGVPGVLSAAASGFPDVFSIADIIMAAYILAGMAGVCPPFHSTLGIFHIIKGVLMSILTLPYGRF